MLMTIASTISRFGAVLLCMTAGTAFAQVLPAPADADERQATNWLADVEALRRPPNPNATPSSPARPMPRTIMELLRTTPSGESVQRLPLPLRRAITLGVIDLRLRDDDVSGAVDTLRSIEGGPGPDGLPMAAAVLRAWARINGSTYDKMITPVVSRRFALPVTAITRRRNTADLARLAATLREILHAPPPTDTLVNAYVSIQGREIAFEPDDLKQVFGPDDAVDVETLLALTTTLRANIVTAEQALVGKTADARSLAVRDVAAAYAGIEQMLLARMKTSNVWRLGQQLAASRYRYCEFSRTNGFEAQAWPRRRAAAFDAFAEAAERYQMATQRDVDGANPYDDWFNAATGALSPAQPGVEPQPDPNELQRLGSRIRALPANEAEQRFQRLADFIMEQTRKASPEFRQQYVRAGLTVISGHTAVPLRRVAGYYDDLIADLKLTCALDGAPEVGVNQTFGVRVALLHSAVLDREVGGFSRLLRVPGPGGSTPTPGAVQQNNLTGSIDYRTRMEDRLRRMIGAKLEIVNVVWADGKSPALPATPDGWTQTPLAYLIVKATDASVDVFPSLQLDLDFADKSDNDRVVLPVMSEALVLNARTAVPRPYEVTSVTQLLDDRTLPAGYLNLEVKVVGHGLLPPIDQLLDLQHSGWTIGKITESGLLADRYDAGSASGSVAMPNLVSQRTCSVTYAPPTGGEHTDFGFATPSLTAGPMPAAELRRYVDGDLVPAAAVMRLPASTRHRLPWGLAATGAALLVASATYVLARIRRRRTSPGTLAGPQLPQSITPFTATAFLTSLRSRESNGVSASTRHDLDRAITDLEARYYASTNEPSAAMTPEELRAMVTRFAS